MLLRGIDVDEKKQVGQRDDTDRHSGLADEIS
jgi:hypothetical protein